LEEVRKMRIGRLALSALVLTSLSTMSPIWAYADKDKERHEDRARHTKIKEYEEGRAFCPSRALVIGGTIVPAGRCYQVAVLRDHRGTFLAFMDPEVRIPHGKIKRLEGEEGRKIKTRIFFLVPIQRTAQIAVIPVNTIQLIRLREEDEDEDEDEDAHEHDRRPTHSTLVVALPNLPVPNVTVVIGVTF